MVYVKCNESCYDFVRPMCSDQDVLKNYSVRSTDKKGPREDMERVLRLHHTAIVFTCLCP